MQKIISFSQADISYKSFFESMKEVDIAKKSVLKLLTWITLTFFMESPIRTRHSIQRGRNVKKL